MDHVAGNAEVIVWASAWGHAAVSVKVIVLVSARDPVLETAKALVVERPKGREDRNRYSMKTKNVTLVITHQCNLNCTYCYEKHKDQFVMSFETAFGIVTDALVKEDDYDFVEFDFFGGEPFLEFDLIRRVVNETKNREWQKAYVFFATTNGTILKEEWKQWLSDNTEFFQVSLSLDGTPEMHNLNRCDSFNLIDVDFFVNTYPDQPVKMTVSEKTLNCFQQNT